MSVRFSVAVLFLRVGLMVLSAQQPTGTGPDAKANQQPAAAAPIDVAPEPTDPVERALQATRNRLMNSHIPP